MTKRYCDRCSKQIIPKAAGLFRVEINYAVGALRTPLIEEDQTWELCPECLKEFKKFLED